VCFDLPSGWRCGKVDLALRRRVRGGKMPSTEQHEKNARISRSLLPSPRFSSSCTSHACRVQKSELAMLLPCRRLEVWWRCRLLKRSASSQMSHTPAGQKVCRMFPVCQAVLQVLPCAFSTVRRPLRPLRPATTATADVFNHVWFATLRTDAGQGVSEVQFKLYCMY
jgi:hypothetical protein